jgi:hypothetical protein
MMVDPDKGPADPKQNPHRLVCHVKANLTPFHDSLTYRVEAVLLPAEGDQPEMDVGRAVYTGTSEMTYYDAREVVRRQEDITGEPRTKTGQTRQWLVEFLSDGPRPRPDVITAGEGAAFAERTINEVARDMVESYRPDGAQATSPVYWRLRSADTGRANSTAEPAEPAEPKELSLARGNADFLPNRPNEPPARHVRQVRQQKSHDETLPNETETLEERIAALFDAGARLCYPRLVLVDGVPIPAGEDAWRRLLHQFRRWGDTDGTWHWLELAEDAVIVAEAPPVEEAER